MNYSEIGKIGYNKTKDKLIAYNLKKQLDVYRKYCKNPNYCAYCNKIIPYKKRRNKFCNHSCSAKKNSSLIIHNHTSKNKCNGCGGY